MILNNGALALKSYIDYDPGPGSRDAIGLVLAKKGKQFIVWSIAKDRYEESWDCQTGDYFDDFELASHMFGLRLQRRLSHTEMQGVTS